MRLAGEAKRRRVEVEVEVEVEDEVEGMTNIEHRISNVEVGSDQLVFTFF